jgi:hypothetical protein
MKEDIIKWAREAGFTFCEESYKYQPNCLFYGGYAVDEQLKRFAALVAADEREAVCRIVTGLCISDNNAEEINRAIRARGQDPMPLFDDWGSWKK